MSTPVTRTASGSWTPGSTVRQQPGQAQLRLVGVLIFLVAHVPLGLLMFHVPTVGKIHAYTTLVVGVAWAVSRGPLDRAVNVIAYIAGAEVLWRMTHADVYWEFGKYATVLICLPAIQRTRPFRISHFPLVFLALLVPSALLATTQGSFGSVFKGLSFNLSGPLALAVCAAFFLRVRMTSTLALRMIIASLGPIVGIIAVILLNMSALERITFTTESNAATSGGFGANQVGTILGFGALLAFLLATVVLDRKHQRFRWLMLGLTACLAVQSVLTFSRSGLYLAVASGLAAMCFGVRDASKRRPLLIMAGLLCLAAYYVVTPRLDEFTEGAFTERFLDTGMTGRDSLMQQDFQTWMEHPLFGVGAGQGYNRRFLSAGHSSASHSEVTRLLAEHGAFGAVALVILIVSGWQCFRRINSRKWKAFAAALIVFAFATMTGNAMRIVLPSFAFGIVWSSFADEDG